MENVWKLERPCESYPRPSEHGCLSGMCLTYTAVNMLVDPFKAQSTVVLDCTALTAGVWSHAHLLVLVGGDGGGEEVAVAGGGGEGLVLRVGGGDLCVQKDKAVSWELGAVGVDACMECISRVMYR
jgi:hypothetical protein